LHVRLQWGDGLVTWQSFLGLGKSKVLEKYQAMARSTAYSAAYGLGNEQEPVDALEDRICGAQ
jgi:hypothetical protein